MTDQTTPGRLRGAIRTIRRPTAAPDELDDPKIAAAAVLLLVLLPLLPVLAVAWTISRTLRGVQRRVSWE
jgi:hypothetical protein